MNGVPGCGVSRPASVLFAAALVCCTAPPAPAAERAASPMAESWVFYTRSVGSAGTLGGSFTAEAALVRTDASLPGIPRIGFFRRPAEAGEFSRLATSIRALGAPRRSGTHFPGAPLVSLGIMKNGKAEVVHGQVESALNPAEKQVFSSLESTVEEVLKHPHRALEASIEWVRGTIEPDDELAILVRVSNPGLVPVPFVHPAGREEGESGLAVVLARLGPDGVPLEAREVTFEAGEVSEMGPDGKPVAGPYAAIVELAPGKELRLRARSRVRFVPASYRPSARIDVEAPPDSDEKAVSGTISVELPPLGVVRPGAKRGKD
ncbi:MAG: hypothetical protein ACYDBY_13635 [Thermoanaerobaculia bacterium]